MINETKHLLNANGYNVLKNFTPESSINQLSRLSLNFKEETPEVRKNVFAKCKKVQAVFKSIEIQLNARVLNCEMTPYCFYLEKTAQKNWPLQMHQDINLPKYLMLSKEANENWLNNGFWVRVNLDSNDETTGALKVIPKSHWDGKNAFVDKNKPIFLDVDKGDIVLFSPLLYHGSDKMKKRWERKIFQCFFLKK